MGFASSEYNVLVFVTMVAIVAALLGAGIWSVEASVKTGTVVPFAGSDVPEDYLLCDGTSYKRCVYPRLFKVIGTAYGSDSATMFNVPDMRSVVPMGAGDSYDLAQMGGSKAVSLSVSHLPAHMHTIIDRGHEHGFHTRQDDFSSGLGVANVGHVGGALPSMAGDDSGSTFTWDGTTTNTVLGENGTTGLNPVQLTTSGFTATSHISTDTTGLDGTIIAASVPFNIINPFVALNYIIKC